jgi:hypothetical protein
MQVSFRSMSLAAVTVFSLVACEGAPPETDTLAPVGAELGAKEASECQLACTQIESCLHGGGYGNGYGGYGNGYGGYGNGYGGYGSGYGGYGSGYGGYGSGYGSCGYAECGHGASSPTWCGYGGYGDGYGGYGELPGYGGYGYGGCGQGAGPSTFDQCVAGCTKLPRRARNGVVTCVLSAHSCPARMACE